MWVKCKIPAMIAHVSASAELPPPSAAAAVGKSEIARFRSYFTAAQFTRFRTRVLGKLWAAFQEYFRSPKRCC